MNLLNRILVSTFVILCLFSCKKILNVPPQNVILANATFNNVKDLQAGLMAAYDGMQSGSVLNGDMVSFSELLSDEGVIDPSKLNSFDKLEIYQMTTTVQLLPLRNMWKDAYNAINRANIVINKIDNPSAELKKDPDFEKIKDLYKGEALFIRALMHFQLCRFWALPYNVATPGANNQLGIPLRLNPLFSLDDNFNLARSTVEEVYKQVLVDLELSSSFLAKVDYNSNSYSKINGGPIRCHAATPKALIARVAFMSGQYTYAASAALEVINGNQFQIADTNNCIKIHTNIDYAKSSETIFQLYNSSLNGDGNNNLSYVFRSSSNGGFISVPASFNLKFETGDFRESLYGVVCSKYLGSGVINFSIIRLSELYLTYIESIIMEQGSANATALLLYNTLRQNRFKAINYTAETLTGLTLAKCKNEREIELAFEGDRLWNGKRMQLPIRNNVEWNNPKSLFKIPVEEINGNNLIVQNP
jgi:hypothetical protein